MSHHVFLATLGQRPEAMTMALDILQARFTYKQVGVLHTDAQRSGIQKALQNLKTVMATEFPQVQTVYHELCDARGRAIVDIQTQADAEAYYVAMLDVFQHYLSMGANIHLLISGGRKAMSVYATLAASLAFTPQDVVYAILSPQAAMQAGVYRVQPEWRDHVQLVELPFVPSPWLPGSIASRTVADILDSRKSPRTRFLSKLTTTEAQLVQTISSHRYRTTQEIADILSKSPRTIENQLGSIYSKMELLFEGKFNRKRKRQALLDILDQTI